MPLSHADRAVEALSTSVHAPGRMVSQAQLLGVALTPGYTCWAACAGALSLTETEASWLEPSVATRAPAPLLGAGPCFSSQPTAGYTVLVGWQRLTAPQRCARARPGAARRHRQWHRRAQLVGTLATTGLDHRSPYPSTAKVWQTLNIGKAPGIPNNQIISGPVHGQM